MVTIDTSQTLTGTYSFASEVYFLKDMAMRNITINESATIESKDLHWWASHEERLKLLLEIGF